MNYLEKYLKIKNNELFFAVAVKRSLLEKFKDKLPRKSLLIRLKKSLVYRIYNLRINYCKDNILKENIRLQRDLFDVDEELRRIDLPEPSSDNYHYLAQYYLKGRGLEIGGAACNEFGLNTKNLDIPNKHERDYQINGCGTYMPIDVKKNADSVKSLFKYDYIISSHVLEHMSDPISALIRWSCLLKEDGILFLVLPHKDRMFDRDKKTSTLNDVIRDYEEKKRILNPDEMKFHKHYWRPRQIEELISWINQKKLGRWKILKIVDDCSDREDSFLFILKKVKRLDPKSIEHNTVDEKRILVNK